MDFVFSYDALDNLLTTATATGPPAGMLNGAKLHLFKAPFSAAPLTRIADLIEADFAGYAPVPVTTWGLPYAGPDGQMYMKGGCHQFTPTDETKPNTIYGYWIDNGATPVYPVTIVTFDSPQTAESVYDAVMVEAVLVIPAHNTVSS
jgi:hypothetical protein